MVEFVDIVDRLIRNNQYDETVRYIETYIVSYPMPMYPELLHKYLNIPQVVDILLSAMRTKRLDWTIIRMRNFRKMLGTDAYNMVFLVKCFNNRDILKVLSASIYANERKRKNALCVFEMSTYICSAYGIMDMIKFLEGVKSVEYEPKVPVIAHYVDKLMIDETLKEKLRKLLNI